MKRIILIIMMFSLFLIYSEDTKDFKINKTWIQVKKRSRVYFQKRDLLDLDVQTVKILQDNAIPADLEPDVADLLNDIIIYDALDAKENSIAGIELLEKKFVDKKHFFRIAADYTNNYGASNPLLVAQFFKSMKSSIKSNFEDNLTTLNKLYEIIRPTYILGAKSGTVKYQNDTIIKFLKEYLDEFDRLLKAREIERDTPYEQTITKIKLDLEKYQL
jgi:hypothetical protein